MTKYLFGQWQTGSHQDARPDDSVEAGNVFAHQMNICWPEFLEQFIVIGPVTQCGNIVGQCVKPYVDNVFVVDWHRNPPVKSSAGDTQIFQPLFDKADHFIAACYRLDKVWMIFNVLQQLILIFAHFEEVAFFFD